MNRFVGILQDLTLTLPSLGEGTGCIVFSFVAGEYVLAH